MEENSFCRNIKNLYIGDFCIACSGYRTDGVWRIPFSGMAFYHPGNCEKDFSFTINCVEPDESGRLLFGSAEFMVPTFLYQRENGEYDWLTRFIDGRPELSFHISKSWTDFILYYDQSRTEGERAFREFGSLFSYAVLNHGACVLHGVLMEYAGIGILVTAASGIGKTTHTRMWRDRERALILNGDRCLCRKKQGRWYAYGMPWSGSSGEYINRSVPINAIVCLRQAQENRVRQMSIFEGTISMMQRVYAPTWPCMMQKKALDFVGDLAVEVPILEMFCRPDFEAVDVLKEAVLNLGEME